MHGGIGKLRNLWAGSGAVAGGDGYPYVAPQAGGAEASE